MASQEYIWYLANAARMKGAAWAAVRHSRGWAALEHVSERGASWRSISTADGVVESARDTSGIAEARVGRRRRVVVRS